MTPSPREDLLPHHHLPHLLKVAEGEQAVVAQVQGRVHQVLPVKVGRQQVALVEEGAPHDGVGPPQVVEVFRLEGIGIGVVMVK